MKRLGLCGVVRGKPVRTTVSDKATPRSLGRVNRQFRAERPNALWKGLTFGPHRIGRAKLGYLTPAEVFFNHDHVALQS